MEHKYETAVFAGWCFWCIDSAMRWIEWVIEVKSWFSGWDEKHPSYREVCGWYTGHREAVQVIYDPDGVSYLYLVSLFWRQIDPTDNEGQFADRWDHYRTAIFYTNEYQREIAEASRVYIESLDQFDEDIATEILEFTSFYEAEDYHQDYWNKESCHYQMYKRWSGRAGYIEWVWWDDEFSLISREDYERIQEKYTKV